jgi:DNA invertase Pin-like site-specific DNA recombinase
VRKHLARLTTNATCLGDCTDGFKYSTRLALLRPLRPAQPVAASGGIMSTTATQAKPGVDKSLGRVFAYLRVSTDSQEVASQKVGIVDYTKAHSLRVDEWFEETVSGAVDASKRDLGAKLLPKLKGGDALIIPELSRLGRSTVDVLATLKQLSERRVRVHVVKGSMVLDDSINSKILSTVLGLAAEIERDLIRQRSVEGQARAKAAGKHIGRPRIENDADRRSKLDKHAEDIKRCAGKGITKANLARLFDCDWITMDQWLRRHGVAISRS